MSNSDKGSKFSNSKEAEDEKEKIDSLVEMAQQTLYRVESVFPFDLFPDEIRIDENKVSIVRRNFFFTEDVVSILIKDIRTIMLSTSVFFASLKFDIRGYEENPEPVEYLPKNQAIRARRIILGLLASEKREIDVSKIDRDELVIKMEEVGRARENS